jgi:hypothetical protein
MQRQLSMPAITGVVSFCVLAMAFAQGLIPGSRAAATRQVLRSASPPQVPTEAELKARADALVANQHADDAAVAQYEYVERQFDRSGGPNPQTLEEKTFRVVPTGTGTLKILLRADGRETDPAEYRRQLEAWQKVLELALRPNDPRAETAYAKFEKRRRDRAQLVNATRDAFLTKWARRETVSGHDCDVFDLTPNPQFRPHSMLQEALTHFTAKVWVDHEANQLVKGEAHCMRDISVGGGLLGKLYRGSVFSFEQAPVAPGVWLPTRYQYDFSGRKFFLTFEVHQLIEASQYHRLGPPQVALGVVKNEIASGKTYYSDP